jgi:hypothetical protein
MTPATNGMFQKRWLVIHNLRLVVGHLLVTAVWCLETVVIDTTIGSQTGREAHPTGGEPPSCLGHCLFQGVRETALRGMTLPGCFDVLSGFEEAGRAWFGRSAFWALVNLRAFAEVSIGSGPSASGLVIR